MEACTTSFVKSIVCHIRSTQYRYNDTTVGLSTNVRSLDYYSQSQHSYKHGPVDKGPWLQTCDHKLVSGERGGNSVQWETSDFPSVFGQQRFA